MILRSRALRWFLGVLLASFLLNLVLASPWIDDWDWRAEQSVVVAAPVHQVRAWALNATRWPAWYAPFRDDAILATAEGKAGPKEDQGLETRLTWRQEGEVREVRMREEVGEGTMRFAYRWARGRLIWGEVSVLPNDTGETRVTLRGTGNAGDRGPWYDKALHRWLPLLLEREFRASLDNLPDASFQ